MIILKGGEKKTVSVVLCLHYFRKWRKGVGRLSYVSRIIKFHTRDSCILLYCTALQTSGATAVPAQLRKDKCLFGSHTTIILDKHFKVVYRPLRCNPFHCFKKQWTGAAFVSAVSQMMSKWPLDSWLILDSDHCVMNCSNRPELWS